MSHSTQKGQAILEMFPKPISWLGMEKQNLTQQKPGLVASYNIRPGNGEGIFWFRRFINLSLNYLLSHLPTYLQPRHPRGAHGPRISEVRNAGDECSRSLQAGTSPSSHPTPSHPISSTIFQVNLGQLTGFFLHLF